MSDVSQGYPSQQQSSSGELDDPSGKDGGKAMSTSTLVRGTNGSAEPHMNRDQAADALAGLLTDDPQSGAALARKLGYRVSNGSSDIQVVHNALRVLEARHDAKKTNTGWVRYDAAHEAALAHPQDIEFPYKWAVVSLDQMFIDAAYQRPLTAFVRRIQSRFDPLLFGVLVLSDRGVKTKPRYALVDGQTRWVAARNIGVQQGPAIVFTGLTPQDEADMFAKLQKERRGMLSYHRFRAQLAARKPEAIAIQKICKASGYKLGAGPGEMRAVAALEHCYKIDDFLLERVLSDFREAWPDVVPEAKHIRGLHYFFRHFPLDKRTTQEVDDERLIRRLKATGPDGLSRKASAAKEAGFGTKGASDKWMAQAVQAAYLSGGRG